MDLGAKFAQHLEGAQYRPPPQFPPPIVGARSRGRFAEQRGRLEARIDFLELSAVEMLLQREWHGAIEDRLGGRAVGRHARIVEWRLPGMEHMSGNPWNEIVSRSPEKRVCICPQHAVRVEEINVLIDKDHILELSIAGERDERCLLGHAVIAGHSSSRPDGEELAAVRVVRIEVLHKPRQRVVAPDVILASVGIPAVAHGVGLGFTPLWLVRTLVDRGEVEIILEGFEVARVPIHAVWPPTKVPLAKAQLFTDSLTAY